MMVVKTGNVQNQKKERKNRKEKKSAMINDPLYIWDVFFREVFENYSHCRRNENKNSIDPLRMFSVSFFSSLTFIES